MRIVLRVGLLSLLTTLTLTTFWGGRAFAARNLFDADYQDCPAGVRVASLTGVKAVRTTKDEELKVEWNAAPWASWNLHGATAEITVQVQSKDRTKTLQTANKALGATSTTFTKVDLATDWVIQVAVTDRKKVISDIVEVEFTSGVKKPLFFSGLYWAGPVTGGHTTQVPSGVTAGSSEDTSVDKAADKVGDFYYLGFNKYFDNWYVEGVTERYDRNGDGVDTDDRQPNTAKFRVGLRHGVANPGDADFDHFRIRVTDDSGDNVLGFDAETVVDSVYPHGAKELALHTAHSVTATAKPAGMITNIALSNRVTDDGQRVAALYEAPTTLVNAMTDFNIYGIGTGFDPAAALPSAPANVGACQVAIQNALGEAIRSPMKDLSFAQLKAFATTEDDRAAFLYAELPDQIYDLPKDIFRRDGTYTLQAWAEDAKDNQISPRATIVVNVQERLAEQGGLSDNQGRRQIGTADGVRFVAGTGGTPNRCEVGTEPTSTSNLYSPYWILNYVGEALVVGLTITQK